MSISLLNIDRFSQFFHRHTQLELCNKINEDPTSPQNVLLHYLVKYHTTLIDRLYYAFTSVFIVFAENHYSAAEIYRLCWLVYLGMIVHARVDVGRSEPATAGVRDKLAVVYKICCSCIMQRPVDQEGQLELDSLSDWKPVELPQHWCDVVTSTSAGDESRCSVLHRL